MIDGSAGGGKLQRHQATLLVAAIASLLLWVLPGFGFILLPLQYLNTHLHEFSHALVATITGGHASSITVRSDGSGVTSISGGSMVLTSSAGYLGATIIGGLMILSSRSDRGAKTTLRLMACLLLLSFVLWIRGDWVGVFSGVLWIVGLLALPSITSGRNLVFASQFIGMQQCLASVQALYVLLKISAYSNMQSDAENMAGYSGVPALFWALLWGGIGLAALFVTLRLAWRSHPAT